MREMAQRATTALLIAAVAAVMATGCGPYVSYKKGMLKPKPPEGLVVFYRPFEFFGKVWDYIVWEDKKAVVQLMGTSCHVVPVHVSAGTHRYTITHQMYLAPEQHFPVEITVEPGKTYYVRLVPGRAWVGGGHKGYKGKHYAYGSLVDPAKAEGYMHGECKIHKDYVSGSSSP